MHTTTPARPEQRGLGFAIAGVVGFTIGAIVTFLATVAILPDGSGANRTGLSVVAGEPGAGELSVGADGEVVETYVDEQGNIQTVTRSGGGTSGTAGSTAGGTKRTKSGTAGTGGTEGSSGRAGGTAGGGAGTSGGSSGGSTGGSSGGAGSAACAAGKNGGSTDTGVTGSEIKLGATVVESGIAQSFLGQVRQAMEAMKNKVNRAGGICGRQLRIIYKDDGWDASRGATFIQNLVQGEKVFALAVSPSSEGLNQASGQGYFQAQGVPVVGADGLNATQFKDPMIWPVAAATTTTIDVMMKNAYDRGARNPAIVFGNTYRFGVEGAYAANAAWNKLTGSNIDGYKNPLASGGGGCEKRFCGVSAGTGQYGNQVSSVNTACNQAPACDYMILLLEPKTAQDWMAVPGVKTPAAFAYGMGGPQPLFTFDFGRNCGDKCAGMWVWTGYNPPIEQYRGSQAVATYVSDLKAQSASADEYNQFSMGGYVGMQLLVEALKQTGPTLTRGALTATLDSMGPLETGLTTALQWRPSARYANHSAQAFAIQSKNGFTGWSFAQAPIRDPWLGQHGG